MRGTLRQQIRLAIGLTALVAAAAGGVAAGIRPGAEITVIALSPVVGWFVGQMIARRMTLHLERLASSAASFASGSRSVRASTDGPREVRLIAEAFNRMADEVASAFSRVRAEETRKTQFVSDVSHELRTPLTAIRGAAETLLDGGVSPDDQERFLSTIALEAERLTRLANDLLQLQRIEGATGEITLRQVDLRLASERAAAMLEPLIEDRVVTLEVVGAAPMVLGDVDRLQQVVANLVDNASRFVGEGGRVTVELSGDAGSAVLTVIDNGPGIPEDDLSRLFDRFYRADSSRTRTSGGAGLGLAIVRAIVSAHGGTITARNLETGGSSFTVTLPAAPL
jgi:two-component system OmpR family sensor kinase